MMLRFHNALGDERGFALVIALLTMVVMIAIGSALMLAAATESKITRNFRNGTEALYAADAVVEWAVAEIRRVSDWNQLLAGSARSSFADGDPNGIRLLADGKTIDLSRIRNDLNCRSASGCSDAMLDAITAERPWGANNPRWQPFAWGYLDALLPGGAIDSPFYVVVFVADDPSECDDNPFVDGGAVVSCSAGVTKNPGTGVLSVRAEAFGPFGAHRVVELTIARAQNDIAIKLMPDDGAAENYDNAKGPDPGQAELRILSWREVK
jgi:type IV pilus assembly PilX-like protein